MILLWGKRIKFTGSTDVDVSVVKTQCTKTSLPKTSGARRFPLGFSKKEQGTLVFQSSSRSSVRPPPKHTATWNQADVSTRRSGVPTVE